MRRHAAALEQIDDAAARWVARRDGGLSVHEAEEFERWCAESTLHREALARFDATWTGLARPTRAGVNSQLRVELDKLARMQRRRRVVAVASSFVILFAVAFAWRAQSSNGELNPAAVAPHSVVLVPTKEVLPDGSVVEYPRGAKVVVDFSQSFRRIKLTSGEAHFAVVKDPSRPFVVEAGGVEVRAVGTAFSVQLGSSQVDVLVTEGRVAIDKSVGPAAEPIAYVDAGNRLTVEVALQPVAAPAVQPVAAAEMATLLAWRKTRVEFSNAPLSEVVRVLNEHNRTSIDIGDKALESVSVSGLFVAEDLETFTTMLATGFEIRSSRVNGRVILGRR